MKETINLENKKVVNASNNQKTKTTINQANIYNTSSDDMFQFAISKADFALFCYGLQYNATENIEPIRMLLESALQEEDFDHLMNLVKIACVQLYEYENSYLQDLNYRLDFYSKIFTEKSDYFQSAKTVPTCKAGTETA